VREVLKRDRDKEAQDDSTLRGMSGGGSLLYPSL